MVDTKSWIKRAGEAAQNYRINRRKLGAMRRYQKRNQSNLVYVKAAERDIIAEVSAVDKAFVEIAADNEALSFADLLYRKRGHPSVSGCARALLMPIDQAHKHNKAFLRLVANNFDIRGE